MSVDNTNKEKVNSENKDNLDLISKECLELLQMRIRGEEESSRLFLSMSYWLKANGYCNSSCKWLKYSEEELVHASWAKDYLTSLGLSPKVSSLTEPKCDFNGLDEIIKLSYDNEIKEYKECNTLADKALKENDHMLYVLAGKYLKHQICSIKDMKFLLNRVENFGEGISAMRQLDSELK